MPTAFEERRVEIERLLGSGQGAAARRGLLELESLWKDRDYETSRIAELYTRAGRHTDALRCQRRAVALAPDNPLVLYNLASSLIAAGDLVEAERVLSRVIALNPHDCDAYYNRATLRQQTAASNHVNEILAELESPRRPVEGEAALCYALAKEFEDLGDADLAYSFLERGATARRRRLSYRVETDEEAMRRIAEAFPARLFSERPAEQRARASAPSTPDVPDAAHDEASRPQPRHAPEPIFIIGLPRSGTTLVDRILSSHSDVASLGEVNDFALCMMQRLAGPAQAMTGKADIIRRAATMDFAALGAAYLESIAGYEQARPRLIDKTPLNYLYLGLIHLALPRARVIHLRRHPMDGCLAMYRTLFRMGYPFSYDLTDLGRYYIAYHRLMQHWREALPGAFLEVDYESIVTHQEAETRRLLDYCGLEFQAGCLEFHRNEAPVATASAAQVRKPLYSSAVHRWRRHEKRLAPLAQMLREAGIEIDRG